MVKEKILKEERPAPQSFPFIDARGREIVDSTPLAPPVGFQRQPHIWEQMREVIRNELAAAAANAGVEDFEEADDFDIGDDYDPSSPYEQNFDPTPVRELRRRASADEEELAARRAEPQEEPPRQSSAPPPVPAVDPPTDGPKAGK